LHVDNDEPSPEVTQISSPSCETASEQAPGCSRLSPINIQPAQTAENATPGQHSNDKSSTTFHELISEHATPKVPRNVTSGRKRKPGYACVITTSPFRKRLNEAKERKLEKERKKEVRKEKAESKKMDKAIKIRMKENTAKVSNGKKSRKKTSRSTVPDNSLTEICGNCGFTYGEPEDPLVEDKWWQCLTCQRWCHESCGTTVGVGFVCAACE
jgi:hypothetical protein